jgi:hypothetical protein
MKRIGRINYFNPGHETAVLNNSKYYHSPAHVAKMQADLAFLPAWYAAKGDFVFIENPLPDDFILSIEPLNSQVNPVVLNNFALNTIKKNVIESAIARSNPTFLSLWRRDGGEVLHHSTVDLWGISLSSVHFFEEISKRQNLSLAIPCWKEEFRYLGSRFASQKILASLLERIPKIEKEILPHFVSGIEAVEQHIAQSRERFLIKSPYSSSGRGLLWLPLGKLTQSERQILTGMLKKQKQVSIEKVLDKQMDFSMHFEITVQKEVKFIGYSIFQTNAKGAYEKSRLDSQDRLEKQITPFVDKDLLIQTQTALSVIMQEMYAPYYTGAIGVDMMIYKAGNSYRFHPCVEINMRKSMGYLAIRLFEKYLHPDSQGEFFIEYNSNSQTIVQKHKLLQKQYPLIMEKGSLSNGYLSLCPVTDSTNYFAYIVIQSLRA